MSHDPRSPHDPYQALRYRDYRLLLAGNLVANVGSQMVALAVGWELYQRTDSALALGLVGLVQLLPVLAFALVAGHLADNRGRKAIVIGTQYLIAASSLGLAALSHWQGPLGAVYACLLFRGVGTAFNGPALRALPAEVIPEAAYENAMSWRNTAFQASSIVGPALGGLLLWAFGEAAPVYLIGAVAGLAFAAALYSVRGNPLARRRATARPLTLRALGEGIGFLRQTPIIFWAITLDLFAVLFGGATTLLPIFARDILRVGPAGLGWLQAAPSISAVFVGLLTAHRPPMQRAGRTLLLAVAGFGLATVVFGVSHRFWLSFAMLMLLGGLDGVSMIVRSTLTLTRVPDAMRGRVAAIEGVFIGTSNQLGGFESGLTAQLFGPVLSVVGGGIATVVVVLLVARLSRELRELRTLRGRQAEVGVAKGQGAD